MNGPEGGFTRPPEEQRPPRRSEQEIVALKRGADSAARRLSKDPEFTRSKTARTEKLDALEEGIREGITTREAVNRDLAATIAEIEKDSVIDPLTGLYNRAGINREAREILARNVRYGGTVSVAYLDLDHFKEVNDNNGHAKGDEVLIATAQHLKDHIREGDITGRDGGEEFVIMTTNNTVEETRNMLNRLRKDLPDAVSASGIELADEQRVTASIGFAHREIPIKNEGRASGDVPEENTFEAFKGIADQRLYQAKNAGRDQVVGPPTEQTE